MNDCIERMAVAARERSEVAVSEGLRDQEYWRAVVMAALKTSAPGAVGEWRAPDRADPQSSWHVAALVDWGHVPHGTQLHPAPPDAVLQAHVLAAFEAGWRAAQRMARQDESAPAAHGAPVGSMAYFSALRALVGEPSGAAQPLKTTSP